MAIQSTAYETIPTEVSKATLKYRDRVRKQSVFMLVVGIFFTLFTYQYFHHGLWGKLNNYNKLPLIVLSGTTVQGNQLNLILYRPNGPDSYGSFVEKVTLTVPGASAPVETWTPSELAKIPSGDIHNAYPYQVIKTGPWGLVVPLSAKATVKFPLTSAARSEIQRAGKAEVMVEDVSGVKWTYTVSLK